MYRKTFVEINLDNLSNNVHNIISKYNNYKYYIAMVKCNAYNHGYYIINELINNGINYLAVSSLDEAISIRKFNKNIPILVCEVVDVKYADIALKNNVTLTVCDVDYLKEIIDLNINLKIHIKIDTGMHRLGVSSKDEFNEIIKLVNNSKIYLEGIYTHFATPGISDKYYDYQIDKFKEITKDINLNEIPIIHLSSSFILLSHPKEEFVNAVRIGTILYGFDISLKSYGNNFMDILRSIKEKYNIKKYNISKTYKDIDLNLKLCFKIKSSILQIKDVKKGDSVGYGLLYKTPNDVKVATIDIGYGDGIGINNNGRKVLINGKTYPVIGEISMCMLSVLVDDKVNVNDEVTIVGDKITLGQIARINNTSFHNTLINIGSNLDKRYIKNNKVVYEEYKNGDEK